MRTILAVTTPLILMLNAPAYADETCNLDIRKGFSQLIDGEVPHRQWVEFNRTDTAEPGQRVIAKDDPIFSADFQRRSEAASLVAPNSFNFQAKGLLTIRRTFEQGTSLRIKKVYTVPSGERFYALGVPQAHELIMFAKPDGTLCSKILNTSDGTYVFLVGEYGSTPLTKLGFETPQTADAPLKLRIIYLGASGGVATFRTIWSRDGRILENQEIQYDQTATKLQIAGMEIPVSNLTADSVTVGDVPLNRQIAWDTYWSTKFRK